ncbi:hypothetical protein ACJRO7_026468 [Eucalyptus globulus]|uniref:S-protein homolog n=1 Tax=Eucalyptus globulus TaxID=34317 RepID=A0ABD3JSZ8_EUCGL
MTKPLAALLLVCSLFVSSYIGSIWKKTHVEIENGLPAGTTLTVHCKSKDDDLGTHHVKDSWEFSFIPNFIDGTFFFCSFSWPGQFERFDIYVQSRDDGECTENTKCTEGRWTVCTWKISPNGPCRLGEEFDACYHWNARS